MPFRQAVSCSGANLPLEIPLRCNRFPVYLWVLCIKTCLPDPYDNVCLGSHLSPVNHRWWFSLLNTPCSNEEGSGKEKLERRENGWMNAYEYEYINILLTNQSALPASLCSELSPSPVPSPSCLSLGLHVWLPAPILLFVNLSNTWKECVQGLWVELSEETHA